MGITRLDSQSEHGDKYSLRARVFNTIRESILSGKYMPGEELKETTIGDELGVSRTPVREALRQLELEGLVEIIPNKGAYVKGITEKDIRDIYALRSLLEGLRARWAMANITDKEIEELEEIQCLFEFHLKHNNMQTIVELDSKFHDILYRSCNSKMLNHTLTDFHHYVERIRKVTLASTERAEKCYDEHMAILEACKNKDADRAEKLANEHVMSTFKNMSEKGIIPCQD